MAGGVGETVGGDRAQTSRDAAATTDTDDVTADAGNATRAIGPDSGETNATDDAGVDEGVAVGRRPTRLSAGLGALALAAGTLLVAGPGGAAVGLVLVGLVAMAVGDELRARDRRAQSVAALAAGGAVGLLGVAGGAALAGTFPATLRALPGLLGVLLFGAGAAPARGEGSRALVKLGAGFVLVGVLVAGVFDAVPAGTLVAGATAAVVGWDLGENAVNVGEQLGRAASTWRTETVHAAGATLVGIAAVLLGDLVGGIGSSGLSLPALALLLVAVVLLSIALHE
ncbi:MULTISPECIES: hypothetical protein [Halorussus]|uniref:DUF7519 family protein n=1 Tax=Halorussus TaxID=1070314 RepID=UPI000E21076D|nr:MULTISPECIES: hypothetical protein [Halorussus]NHN58446.1 hypothetical protein [Halorussus sp. JP-T4]